jgi:hypothetical protein
LGPPIFSFCPFSSMDRIRQIIIMTKVWLLPWLTFWADRPPFHKLHLA